MVFVAGTDAQCQRVARLLETNHIAVIVSPAAAQRAEAQRCCSAPQPEPNDVGPKIPLARRDAAASHVRVVLGHLSEGLRVPDERLVVVTEADVWRVAPPAPRATYRSHSC